RHDHRRTNDDVHRVRTCGPLVDDIRAADVRRQREEQHHRQEERASHLRTRRIQFPRVSPMKLAIVASPTAISRCTANGQAPGAAGVNLFWNASYVGAIQYT